MVGTAELAEFGAVLVLDNPVGFGLVHHAQGALPQVKHDFVGAAKALLVGVRAKRRPVRPVRFRTALAVKHQVDFLRRVALKGGELHVG